MNDEFKEYFAGRLNQFKNRGSGSLRSEILELIDRTSRSDASKAYLHFVADVCTELKDFQSAVKLLRLVESKFELDSVGYNNLAFCLWEMNLQTEAYTCYEKSLQLNPTNVSSLRGACFLAIETDHDEDGVVYCRKATEAAPHDRELAIWYATALSNTGNVGKLKEFIAEREIRLGRDEELNGLLES